MPEENLGAGDAVGEGAVVEAGHAHFGREVGVDVARVGEEAVEEVGSAEGDAGVERRQEQVVFEGVVGAAS